MQPSNVRIWVGNNKKHAGSGIASDIERKRVSAMEYNITVSGRTLPADAGENLLEVLRRNGLAPDAPCGGNGVCGKCKVKVNGEEVLSCRYAVEADCTVEVSRSAKTEVLTAGAGIRVPVEPLKEGYLAAFDIGTTTVVCFLLSADGTELAVESMLNPQQPFGADVISRIQSAAKGEREALTARIRKGMSELVERCCRKAGILPQQIGVVSVVANPCMQQLFMGMDVSNLAAIPFAPVITKAQTAPAKDYLPLCSCAELLIVPDIAGYVGADTMGCVLATGMYQAEDTVLMVDIGTNGEMVLAHMGRLVSCSTAAGPALEGANIQFGMRGSAGAIDHVTEAGFTVIGGGAPVGICGSGLIDAVAVMLRKGILNKRGRVNTQDRNYYLTDNLYLTQEDIRQVQMAKGAIAAGIHLMAEYLGIAVSDIDRVILAGAFGSFMDPDSACRIGLLPEELRGKITAAGNIAGSGSKMLALNKDQLALSQELVERIEFLELASQASFQRTFARNMTFREG